MPLSVLRELTYDETLYWTAVIFGSVSILACVASLWFSIAWQRDSGLRLDVHSRLSRVTLGLDILFTALLLSNPMVSVEQDSGWCLAQGMLLYCVQTAYLLWFAVVYYIMWSWLYKKRNIRRYQGRLVALASICVFLPCVVGVTSVFVGDAFNFYSIACFMSEESWYIGAVLVPFLVIWTWVLGCTLCILASLKGRLRKLRSGSATAALQALVSVRRKVIFYIISFSLTNLGPSLSYFAVGSSMGEVSKAVIIAFNAMRGLFDACLWGSILDQSKLDWLREGGLVGGLLASLLGCVWCCGDRCLGCCCGTLYTSGDYDANMGLRAGGMEDIGTILGAVARINPVLGAAPDVRNVTIFTTTLNVGECVPEQLGKGEGWLGEWIPRGYDIYVVALQEVLQLEELRKMILQHLGGKENYVMFGQELGQKHTALGYHGYIALTVWARAADVQTGAFAMEQDVVRQAVKRGKQVVGGVRASNKGAAGVAMRIHGTSVGFLGVHFAADSKGKTRLDQRNEDSRSILLKSRLVNTDLDVDLVHSHHHVVVLGDLNYRLSGMEPSDILTGVAKASLETSLGWNAIARREGLTWRQCAYGTRLKPPISPSVMTPSRAPAEVSVLSEAEPSPWIDLLMHDELTQEFNRPLRSVFCAFREQPILFPPSFRRKKGELGDCGDYTDPQVLAGAYTTQVKEKMGVKGLRQQGIRAAGIFSAIEIKTASMIQKNMKTRGMQQIPASPSAVGDCSAPAVAADDGLYDEVELEGAEQEEEEEEGSRSSTGGQRPPSWTDRILWHSMPDCAPFLRPTGYDSTDCITGSDHRPVSASFSIAVNPSNCCSPPDDREFRAELVLTGLHVELVDPHNLLWKRPGVDVAHEGLGKKIGQQLRKFSLAPPAAGHVMQVVFPIPPEDPLDRDRGAVEAAALLGTGANTKAGGQLAPSKGLASSLEGVLRVQKVDLAANTLSCELVTAQTHGIEMEAPVWPAAGLHAVIQLATGEGDTIGQALLTLSDVLGVPGREMSGSVRLELTYGAGAVGWVQLHYNVCLAERALLRSSSSATTNNRGASVSDDIP
jgi:hypothetical protein